MVILNRIIGTYKYSTGEMYEGDWKNDNKHGKGTIIFIIGKITYNDGESYDGDWLDDKKHGHGNSLFNDRNTIL